MMQTPICSCPIDGKDWTQEQSKALTYLLAWWNKTPASWTYFKDTWFPANSTQPCDFNKGILLMGTVGAGKSTLLKTFCDYTVATCPRGIRFVPFHTWYNDVRERDLAKYKQGHYAFDDVGVELSKSDFHAATAWQTILEVREEALQTAQKHVPLTLLTTNLNTFKEYENPRLVSRMSRFFNIISCTSQKDLSK